MRTLTVTGDWNMSGGVWTLLDSRGRLAAEINPGRCDVLVEDAPLTLPTEPGERFWGRTADSEPQWWFSQEIHKAIWFTPAAYSGGRDVGPHTIEDYGLVRLPDPEAAP